MAAICMTRIRAPRQPVLTPSPGRGPGPPGFTRAAGARARQPREPFESSCRARVRLLLGSDPSRGAVAGSGGLWVLTRISRDRRQRAGRVGRRI